MEAKPVFADGDSWFDSLTPEQQKQYLELHPRSKYGRQSKSKAVEPAKPSRAPRSKTGGEGSHGGARIYQSHAQAIKKLPPKTQEFFKAGGTKPGCKLRKAAASMVRAKSKGILASLKDNCKEWASGASAMVKMARRQPLNDHDKAALKATVKDALSITVYVGLGGGLAHGVGLALAHFGQDMIKDLLIKSVSHGIVHGSLVTAASGDEGEQMLANLIDQIADAVENADIPDSVWAEGIDDAASKAEGEPADTADESVAALSANFSSSFKDFGIL